MLFWVVVVLPAAAGRRRNRSRCWPRLKRGAKVVTTAGIVGKVVTVKDGEEEIVIRSEDAKLRDPPQSPSMKVLGTDEAETAAKSETERDAQASGTRAPSLARSAAHEDDWNAMQRNYLRGLLICLIPCLVAAYYAVRLGQVPARHRPRRRHDSRLRGQPRTHQATQDARKHAASGGSARSPRPTG